MQSLRNTMVRVRGNCRCRQLRNNSSDRADVNRRKSGRDTRYLQNFDGPLELSGRHRQCFLTSATCHLFEKRWRDSMITVVAVSRGACRHCLYFAQNPPFCAFILPSIFRSNFSHFALYQHPPPDGPARRTSS